MTRRSWIQTGLSTLISFALVGCMGNKPALQNCDNNTGPGCPVLMPPLCASTPSASSITSGSDLTINISVSGGTGPYTIRNPKTNTQISFSSNTAITQNYTFSASASTLVSGFATVTDSQGATGSCYWTVTEVPNVTTTSQVPLACSVQLSNSNPSINAPVQVTVSGAGGLSSNYVFGYLNYDNGNQIPLNNGTGSQKSASVVYTSSGQRILGATISDGTTIANCSNMLQVQNPTLSLTAANGITTTAAGNSLSINAAISGVGSNNGVVYQFQSSNPSVLLNANLAGSATVSTVDLNAQSSTITAYASINGTVIASATLNLNFTQNQTTTTTTTIPSSGLVGCFVSLSKSTVSLFDTVNLTITPLGGSRLYYGYLSSTLNNAVTQPSPGSLAASVTFNSAGNAVITAAVIDLLNGNTVSCSTSVTVIVNTIPVYRLFKHNGPGHLFTTSLTERNTLIASAGWIDEGVAFRVYQNYPGTGRAIYRCRAFNGIHFVSEDGNCEGKIYEGTYGYLSGSQHSNEIPIYRKDRFHTDGTWADNLATGNYSEAYGTFIEKGILGYAPAN